MGKPNVGKPDFSKLVNTTKDVVEAAGDKITDQSKQAMQFVRQKIKDVRANGRDDNHEHKQQDESIEKAGFIDTSVISDTDSVELSKVKTTLDNELRAAVTEYNDAYSVLYSNGSNLFVLRTRAVDLIANVEVLINSIANHPKTFDTAIKEIQYNQAEFTDACEYANESLESAKKSALGAGAGAATGLAVASIAPSAALWVATTFGTASTGTAISTLSGAAASKAALAWLGGGALSAGGGGIAAGNSLLVLAGPIGWTISGATLLASISLFTMKKLKQDKQKKDEIESIRRNTHSTLVISRKIERLIAETALLRDKLNQMYSDSLNEYGQDYHAIDEERQLLLGTIVNNTKALSATLGVNIEPEV